MACSKNECSGWFRSFGLASIIVLLSAFSLKAQQGNVFAIHANIMYHFTKYINWPDGKKSGDFVIGVIGNSSLFDELVRITANKTAGGQPIVVRKMSSSAAAYECHILFIDAERSSSVKRISALTRNTPVLLVSDFRGMAQQGSCINFIIVNERLKLEINKTNIEQRNLSIASELLSLGKVVK